MAPFAGDVAVRRKWLLPKVGDSFGRWTVLQVAPPRGVEWFFLCRCSCGTGARYEDLLAFAASEYQRGLHEGALLAAFLLPQLKRR